MRRDPRELAAVFAGGALGAVARTELGVLWPAAPGAWPWATFTVNILGAALLGYTVTALAHRLDPVLHRSFLGAGFCGALTTFSALQLELLRMLDAGRLGLAALYAGLSAAAGLAGVAFGSGLAR